LPILFEVYWYARWSLIFLSLRFLFVFLGQLISWFLKMVRKVFNMFSFNFFSTQLIDRWETYFFDWRKKKIFVLWMSNHKIRSSHRTFQIVFRANNVSQS
jgi:hypothetical protein